MLVFLKRLFHCHEYEVISSGDITDGDYDNVVIGKYIIQRCKICGKVQIDKLFC